MRVRNPQAVTVRETSFGYVIRSDRAEADSPLHAKIVKFMPIVVLIAIVAVWILPMGVAGFALKPIISVMLVAAGFVGRILMNSSGGGYELHVDTSRRELRSAVLTTKGDCAIRNSARFAEVAEPILRKGNPESEIRSLCLRIVGKADVMSVALGDEATLLAVHDRLMRDLRPIEEKLASFKLNAATTRGVGGPVAFPKLGPDEIAA